MLVGNKGEKASVSRRRFIAASLFSAAAPLITACDRALPTPTSAAATPAPDLPATVTALKTQLAGANSTEAPTAVAPATRISAPPTASPTIIFEPSPKVKEQEDRVHFEVESPFIQGLQGRLTAAGHRDNKETMTDDPKNYNAIDISSKAILSSCSDSELKNWIVTPVASGMVVTPPRDGMTEILSPGPNGDQILTTYRHLKFGPLSMGEEVTTSNTLGSIACVGTDQPHVHIAFWKYVQEKGGGYARIPIPIKDIAMGNYTFIQGNKESNGAMVDQATGKKIIADQGEPSTNLLPIRKTSAGATSTRSAIPATKPTEASKAIEKNTFEQRAKEKVFLLWLSLLNQKIQTPIDSSSVIKESLVIATNTQDWEKHISEALRSPNFEFTNPLKTTWKRTWQQVYPQYGKPIDAPIKYIDALKHVGELEIKNLKIPDPKPYPVSGTDRANGVVWAGSLELSFASHARSIFFLASGVLATRQELEAWLDNDAAVTLPGSFPLFRVEPWSVNVQLYENNTWNIVSMGTGSTPEIASQQLFPYSWLDCEGSIFPLGCNLVRVQDFKPMRAPAVATTAPAVAPKKAA